MDGGKIDQKDPFDNIDIGVVSEDSFIDDPLEHVVLPSRSTTGLASNIGDPTRQRTGLSDQSSPNAFRLACRSLMMGLIWGIAWLMVDFVLLTSLPTSL